MSVFRTSPGRPHAELSGVLAGNRSELPVSIPNRNSETANPDCELTAVLNQRSQIRADSPFHEISSLGRLRRYGMALRLLPIPGVGQRQNSNHGRCPPTGEDT